MGLWSRKIQKGRGFWIGVHRMRRSLWGGKRASGLLMTRISLGVSSCGLSLRRAWAAALPFWSRFWVPPFFGFVYVSFCLWSDPDKLSSGARLNSVKKPVLSPHRALLGVYRGRRWLVKGQGVGNVAKRPPWRYSTQGHSRKREQYNTTVFWLLDGNILSDKHI